ncbi:hypothetical protein F5X71_00265 [Nocardia brasiliensis]|uniref:Uncharacterized protein n=1 Tax=Nocardia brasiliensis TaxID=37326 RepID=A0A6G9XJ82_NOCBR|nr:hypothetical protein [Nocardia brasiliensis]QIS00968.1 hypothetical protein F5X71_00265 [Nocardia brasiliensis]
MNTPPETETFGLDYVVERTGVPSERWIRIRLNDKRLRGRRAGRQWRMTEGDIAYLVQFMANETQPPPQPMPSQPVAAPTNSTGLTAGSRRRRERRTH